jgi:hypothetical protein
MVSVDSGHGDDAPMTCAGACPIALVVNAPIIHAGADSTDWTMDATMTLAGNDSIDLVTDALIAEADFIALVMDSPSALVWVFTMALDVFALKNFRKLF